MRGLERNVKLAARSAGKVTLVTYGVSILLILWFCFLNLLEFTTISDAMISYLNFSTIMGGIYLIVYMGTNMTTDFQRALAYGSTRKCAALGMISFAGLMAMMQIAVNTVLYLLAGFAFSKVTFDTYVLMEMLVNYLLAIGVGILAGVVVMRFGKIGYYIALYSIMIVTIIITTFGYMRIDHGGEVNLSPFLNTLGFLLGMSEHMGVAYLAALIVGVALFVLAGSLLVHVTKETEVRV